MHTSLKFREAFCHAHSAWTPLGELVDKGGTLLLDLHGHDYGVEVRITEEAVPKDDEELRRSRVCAQTLLDHSVDYFEDNTESLGVLASPIVWVRFENKVDDAAYNTELDDSYHVKMPHCLVDKEVTKDDLVVAYATFDDAIWEEVSPGASPPRQRHDQPRAVRRRRDDRRRRRRRVHAERPQAASASSASRTCRRRSSPGRAASDLPGARLPDQLKVVERIEMQDRGDASLGEFESASELLGFRLGRRSSWRSSRRSARRTASVVGELQWMDFELDPHFLMKEEQELAKRTPRTR